MMFVKNVGNPFKEFFVKFNDLLTHTYQLNKGSVGGERRIRLRYFWESIKLRILVIPCFFSWNKMIKKEFAADKLYVRYIFDDTGSEKW